MKFKLVADYANGTTETFVGTLKEVMAEARFILKNKPGLINMNIRRSLA